MEADSGQLLSLIGDYLLIIVDISLVAFLFYRIYLLLAKTGGVQIVLGIVIILLLAWMAQIFHLQAASWLVENLASSIVITIIILMAPELRRLVSQLGQGSFLSTFFPRTNLRVDEIVDSMRTMTYEKVGALIVLARQTGLNNYIEKGTRIDGLISSELIRNIFTTKSPLHDGAMIIDRGRIEAASCYLPLSDSRQLKRSHGARHRAALGISEESDALVLVCSEETGRISLCFDGQLISNVRLAHLRVILIEMLSVQPRFQTLLDEGVAPEIIKKLGGGEFLYRESLKTPGAGGAA